MVSGSPPSSASAASPYANRCMYRCLDAAPVSRLILNHGYPLVHGPSSINFFSVTGSRGCCHGRWNTAWMHACSWLIIYQLMKSQSLVSLQLCCQQLGVLMTVQVPMALLPAVVDTLEAKAQARIHASLVNLIFFPESLGAHFVPLTLGNDRALLRIHHIIALRALPCGTWTLASSLGTCRWRIQKAPFDALCCFRACCRTLRSWA